MNFKIIKRTLKSAFLFLVLATMGIGGLLFSKLKHSQPQSLNYLEIQKGTSLTKLSKELAENQVITNAALFRWYMQFTDRATKIKSGVYALPESISMRELGRLLTNGVTASVKITLPEGRTSWEYFDLLQKTFSLDSAVFDSLVNSPTFAKDCSLPTQSLEGYLFPETYHFPIGSTEAEILQIMTKQFHKSLSQANFEDSPVYKKYGLHGLITLASIVEEEAMVKEEQKTIAGVFYNRLVKGWPLGADPTVRFFLRKLTGPLYLSELRTASPYNTRINTGLPPGPISNPGYDAILASAYPDSTDYMFFVAKDNGSREHYFSVTNKQHDRYKKKRSDNQSAQ